MREILFRGKRFDNGEWVYWDRYGRITDINGEPTKNEVDLPTLLPYPTYISDLPIINDETVGEYTGLNDKNGKKIFEGDVIETSGLGYKQRRYPVAFCDGYFGFESKHDIIALEDSEYAIRQENREVIGTIYDNPELLEVEK